VKGGGEGRAATSRPVCAAAAAAEAEEGLLLSSSESPTVRADGDSWVATAAVGTSRSRSRSRLGIVISTEGFASPIAIRRSPSVSRLSAGAASSRLWFLVGDLGDVCGFGQPLASFLLRACSSDCIRNYCT
jgi:hypothetical protein